MADARAFLPLNPREFLILFALVEGEQHGYGLVKAVESQTDGQVRMDPANLYRSIKRLVRDELVQQVGERKAPESNDERRRYYGITRLGREVVVAEAERLDRLAAAARARNLISGRHRPA
jgi:DNA-binding PadR family transcriptional regulator